MAFFFLIVLSKIEVCFLKHFEIWLMNTCHIDLGVFVLSIILFHQIMNENHSSKRGLDQVLSHKGDNSTGAVKGGEWARGKVQGRAVQVACGISCCCLQHLLCWSAILNIWYIL